MPKSQNKRSGMRGKDVWGGGPLEHGDGYFSSKNGGSGVHRIGVRVILQNMMTATCPLNKEEPTCTGQMF